MPDSEAGYGLRSYFSDDGCQTWRHGTSIQIPGGNPAEPTAVQRADGSLLMVIRTPLAHLYRCESDDFGETWSEPVPMLVSPAAPPNIKAVPGSSDLLLVWNDSTAGKRTPLVAAVSRTDGESWLPARQLESDPDRGFAYPSITFVGDEVLFTYYRTKWAGDGVMGGLGWELKLHTYSPVELAVRRGGREPAAVTM